MAENNQNNNQASQDINQLLKVRREKLAALQEAGKDPFVITKYNQTHHSTDCKSEDEALEAKLLADRPEVNVDGLDEEAAKEAKQRAKEAEKAAKEAAKEAKRRAKEAKN